MRISPMSSRRTQRALIALLAISWASIAASARAVNIVLDYSYDTTNFFGAGNPSGANAGTQATAAIEAAALYFSSILNDTFARIEKPPDFHSASFGGVARWDWSLSFPHPSINDAPNQPVTYQSIQNAVIPENLYRIFVGAEALGGMTAGVGGPGNYSYDPSGGGSFSQQEIAQVNAIDDAFRSAVTKRGETSGFASWGGAVTFDRDGSTVWHYNHTTSPTVGSNDFYSVAIHELGHALGLGSSQEWQNLATGATFSGLAAKAAYGGVAPPLNAAREHWASGTNSVVFGTNTAQEAAMDPEITQGTRKRLTALDAGALTDIGWSVVAPSFNSADFNLDGTVNAPDLAIWKAAYKTTTSGNADGDGDTDGNDFLIWQRRLGHAGAIASTSMAIPEPSGSIMTWLAVATIVSHRRRVWIR
jgi:hypothetical protein